MISETTSSCLAGVHERMKLQHGILIPSVLVVVVVVVFGKQASERACVRACVFSQSTF